MTLGLLAVTGTSQGELLNGAVLNIGEGSFFTMGGRDCSTCTWL